jgi:uncharacterized protein (DUF1684 family)
VRVHLLITAILLASACGNKPPDHRTYAVKIDAERAEKDAHFLKSSTPVPADRKKELLPLAYFPIEPSYDVAAILTPAPKAIGGPASPGEDTPGVIIMPTSTGGRRQMRRVGTLEFTLRDQPLKLTAFVEVGTSNLDHLFVPFSDLTTGAETYPAGRYLDLDRNATGIYDLDFNRAYQPYCYYNASYDCPYPPSENRLKVPVRAGERLKRPNI